MRFSFVLAVVAAVIDSISASPVGSPSDADSSGRYCPTYCTWITCCPGSKCEWVGIFNDQVDQVGVSMNSLHPGFNHMTGSLAW
ncbi:uncharacterized protein EDB91DRAFT_1159655 [Suillus paluster]|uniref:uncharacterized protein n=1 Tax=Suillus paluster TaxID=48578 RepID=UPI001B8866FC|nr:uncharacterized protein EDB91DRAFT_1159655 [Suillus paluster]KAG1729306.1 hypothetical protein EDB91DRAFT_1159655 [Suillus paluster]